ncbi:MAG: hypothetical protein M3258_00780 [Thermoproteota archaeon]|nr:hypothetical protein [Thermoproteota archaeon]
MNIRSNMHSVDPTFEIPPNKNAKIWQYMELAEFVSMLHRKALFFVKATKLRDPYEGIIPQFNDFIKSPMHNKEEEAIIQNKSNRFIATSPQSVIQQFRAYRELVLINSWHYNEYESAAMWHLYSHENAGIAIQSTMTKLNKSFEDNNEDTVWIGRVQYLDFSKDWMDEWNNLFKGFLIKRKSFEYENEIRALTCLPDDHLGSKRSTHVGDIQKISSSKRPVFNPRQMTEKGKYVSADLHTLVENIYIAPYSEPWFKEVVESLLSKYDLNAKVVKSDLYTIS